MPIPLGVLAVAGAGGGAAGSFDWLETSLISTNTASVTFSNLNTYSDYKHLQIRLTGRTNRADFQDRIAIRYNGRTTTTYASHKLEGNGSALSSAVQTSFQFIYTTGSDGFNLFAASETANFFGAAIIDILDFKTASKTKTLRMFSGMAGGTQAKSVILSSGFEATAEALTSLTLLPQFGSWVSGTRISLYGIK
jgi:hypothetical protein